MKKNLVPFALLLAVVAMFSFTSVKHDDTKSTSTKIGLEIGDEAPNIIMKGVDGKDIKLSSLRGKMVLIDFWASWCGPCRRENPNVVAAYNKYSKAKFKTAKGFEIFSVSFDQNKTAWEEAIAKDGLLWKNHVCDMKGWANAAGQLYGISSIPSSVLIDENGIIVAKNLRGIALDMELDKYIGQTQGNNYANESELNQNPVNCESARKEYLAKNPDVLKAGADPWSHYHKHGKNEGRVWPSCPETEVNQNPVNCESARKDYLAKNPDVLKAGVDPWSHYHKHGKNEGRVWPFCKENEVKFEESKSELKPQTVDLHPLIINNTELAKDESGKVLNGLGSYTYKNGSHYTGDFVNGIRESETGVCSLINKDEYVGVWKSDLPNGLGIYLSYSSKGNDRAEFKYVGIFVAGQRIGYGKSMNWLSEWSEVYYREDGVREIYSEGNPIHKKAKSMFEKDANSYMNYLNNSLSASKASIEKSDNLNESINNGVCTLPFSTQVPKLNISYYDNRQKCICCGERYRLYQQIDKNSAPVVEEAIYVLESYTVYYAQDKPNYETFKYLEKCLDEFLWDKYGLEITHIAYNRYYQRGNLLPWDKLGTDRKVGLYDFTSEFCEKCEHLDFCHEKLRKLNEASPGYQVRD